MGLESIEQNIIPTTTQTQPPKNTVASLLTGVQNQSPPDPIRDTLEAQIKFLVNDNRSLRNKMNRIFKTKKIADLEEEEEEEEGNEGEEVTAGKFRY